MDTDRLCTWLKLPRGSWPPDHYAILGLEPGTHDPVSIENRVHERMEIMRGYQLTHPELVTEAMNRLAQAMICLTDERSRAVYHAEFFPHLVPKAPETPAPAQVAAGAAVPVEPATWVDYVPAEPAIPSPEIVTEPAVREERVGESPPVRTRRDLYFRIAQTRQVLRLWTRVGEYLNNPERRLTRPSEATDLIRHMQALPPLIQSLRSQLGDAGQPGYLVLALARQQLIVPTLQTLLPSQRQALARDWEAGRNFLQQYRSEIRLQLKAIRERGFWAHFFRLGRALLNSNPGFVLLALVLVALNAAFPFLRSEWIWQVGIVGCLVALKVISWWAGSRFKRVIVPPPAVTSSVRRREQR